MNPTQLERSFLISRVVFQPAPGATTEEARRVHRLRLPLGYEGDDQTAILDFAASVRGEDLQAVISSEEDQADAVKAIVRLETAGIRLGKGSSRPTLTFGLLLETENVDPISSVLGVALRAARNEGHLTVGLRLVQERLPGMEEAGLDQDDLGDEIDARARAERAAPLRPLGSRRRPKGSSPVPRA